MPRLEAEIRGASREPLTPTVKRALLALVIFFHVGGGWALTQVEPAKLIVGDIAPMEVRMVPAEQAAEPEIENAEPPPVEMKPPDLAAIVEPPPDDLPPPEFPIAKIDIPPPEEPPPPVIRPLEKKPDPKPVQRRPPTLAPQAPVDSQPQQAAPQAAAAPRVVADSQLGYLVKPNPVYPARSRKAGERGTVMVRVLIDPTGRPSQVAVQTSSGHPPLDEAALSALRAAQFRPYVEGGVAKPIWVLAPITFNLQ
jgi:periplasmic protein TonB